MSKSRPSTKEPRIVYIPEETNEVGGIDNKTALRAIRQLMAFDAESNHPILVVINSGGGSMPDAMAMHDAILGCRAVVNTLAIGECCSAAVVIHQAGDNRLMTRGAWLMLHPPTMEMPNPVRFPDASARVAAFDRMEDKAVYAIADATGHLISRVRGWSVQETWFDAEDALSEGLIDEIVDGPWPVST